MSREQARAIARAWVKDWAAEEEHLADAIANALAQCEREVWDKAIKVVEIIETGTPDSIQWREGIRSVIKTLQDEAAARKGDEG